MSSPIIDKNKRIDNTLITQKPIYPYHNAKS